MKIKKMYVGPLFEFINKLNLKGRASLGRTKLKGGLSKELDAISEDQAEAITEYDAWTDKEAGKYKTDNHELNKVVGELMNQETEVVYDSPFAEDFKKALEEYDEKLSGADADLYAMLYEKLEGE